ncbi:ankyrin [Rickenella mellea]|uniref:Ankyrin n=1 Tax=Rickenella mellea TaxID=50990 RepID=A0A4R5XE89_9AGAM|nr:ankyrin [Rickenella mellea]
MAEKDATARLRRAVKENNLFLVRRLIQRTDMRNPDPGPRRYTSLAWSAVLGHEETFEYLLANGHDDEELSKDAENNTILILLAELRPGSPFPYGGAPGHPDLMGAALRMARLYYERYPFILEWSNLQGKTALHVGALKGNEELVRMLCDMGADIDLADNLGNTPLHYASAWGHIPVVQLLIERGCQFAPRNNDGFTASDYAYSTNTMQTLQDAARLQFENNKKARRHVFQQAAARGNEWGGLSPNQTLMHPHLLAKARDVPNGGLNGSSRLRSGSGGSRTTATSDSDADGMRASQPQSYGQSSVSSMGSSQPQSSGMSPSGSFSKLPPLFNSGHSSSSSTTTTFSVPSPNQTASGSGSSTNLSTVAPMNPASALSPIVHRMRERDADAMAKFKKRNRSGSAGTSAETLSQSSSSVSTLPVIDGNNSTERSASPSSMLAQVAGRRLRPSMSAAQLRSSPPAPSVLSPQDATPRSRSGTIPTQPRTPTPIEENKSFQFMNGRSLLTRTGSRRAGTMPMLPSDAEDYTGPPGDYAVFPPPPDEGPSTSSVSPSKSTTPTTSRRAAFAILSKPLPSIDLSGGSGGRGHRRGTSTSELRE